MGPSLVQWFVFALVVSFFVAYVASHALPAGSEYLRVFQIVGAVAFLAYARGAAAGGDLDGQAVGGGVEGSVRRAGVRPGDGGCVRLALAAVSRVSRRVAAVIPSAARAARAGVMPPWRSMTR